MNRKKSIILFLAIAIALASTNSSVDAHKEAVKQELYVQSGLFEVTEADLESFATVGYSFTDGAIFSIADSVALGVSRDNYVLFSLTKATHEGSSEIVGTGLLGTVFINDKLKLNDEAVK